MKHGEQSSWIWSAHFCLPCVMMFALRAAKLNPPLPVTLRPPLLLPPPRLLPILRNSRNNSSNPWPRQHSRCCRWIRACNHSSSSQGSPWQPPPPQPPPPAISLASSQAVVDPSPRVASSQFVHRFIILHPSNKRSHSWTTLQDGREAIDHGRRRRHCRSNERTVVGSAIRRVDDDAATVLHLVCCEISIEV